VPYHRVITLNPVRVLFLLFVDKAAERMAKIDAALRRERRRGRDRRRHEAVKG